jgi:hypothetical protein
MNEKSPQWELRKGSTLLATLDWYISPFGRTMFFKNFAPTSEYDSYRPLFDKFKEINRFSDQFDLDDDEYWIPVTFWKQNFEPLGLTLAHASGEPILALSWIEFYDNGAIRISSKQETKG